MDKNTSDDIKQLVIARLQAMPEYLKLSIGDEGEYDKYELITHIKNDDKIGKKIVEIQLHYLHQLKKGIVA